MSDETTTPAGTPPEVEGAQSPSDATAALADPLGTRMRALRDHVLEAFPHLESLGHRGELTLIVPPGDIIDVLRFCKDDPRVACELLSDVSAVHWPGGTIERDVRETTGWPTETVTREHGVIQVDYIVRSVANDHWFRLRVNLDDEGASVASATAVYSSANFMEREVYDLMGVEFPGHPGLTRIMMPDDWEGHPHRKDYPLGGVEVMYKGQTVPPPDERDY